MTKRNMPRWTSAVAVGALGLAALSQAGLAAAHPGRGPDGAVYTQTNAAAGNGILAFDRGADGALAPAGSYATGGLGTGAGLGSQGAVVLDDDLLLAVNAGSDQVSVFRVGKGGLRLTDVEPSGGDQPISVTVHDGLVYVLNAGGTGNVTGFRLSHRGNLRPLAALTRPLSTDASGPAQVEFSPDGGDVAVTEKAANVIDTFPVRHDGRLGQVVVTPSVGQTPFGFAFDRRGRLFVSEAFGGAVGASALSSYAPFRGGPLDVVSASAPTHQTAACWVAVTRNGRYVYTGNTGSNSITGYAITLSGALAPLNADGVTATTGSATTDLALSRASRYLYAHNMSDGSLSGFRVRHDGSLTPAGTTPGLPASAVGLAAE